MTDDQIVVQIAKLLILAAASDTGPLHTLFPALTSDAIDLAERFLTKQDDRSPDSQQLKIHTSIGFSGTQQGMSKQQKDSLRKELKRCKEKGFVTFHHGDCIGADGEAHAIALELGYEVVIHPPTDQSKALNTPPSETITVLPPKPYLERNKDIVLDSITLIAAPFRAKEEVRSGTWATIRFARSVIEQRGSRIIIFGR